MPDGVEKLEREAVLTYEEFLRLAALFAQCGIDTVRVTGGEPLVRKNVAQLVAGLKATPGIRRVTLTTNAVLLAEQLPALLDAGLDSVNISLDTLRPEVFRQITARDYQDYDLLIAMDSANLRNLRRFYGGDPAGKIHMLLEYAGRPGEEVADPWYTGDFQATWEDVSAGCAGLLEQLTEN